MRTKTTTSDIARQPESAESPRPLQPPGGYTARRSCPATPLSSAESLDLFRDFMLASKHARQRWSHVDQLRQRELLSRCMPMAILEQAPSRPTDVMMEPLCLRDNGRLSMVQFLILGAVMHAKRSGYVLAYYSIEELAGYTATSKSTVERALRELRRKRVLVSYRTYQLREAMGERGVPDVSIFDFGPTVYAELGESVFQLGRNYTGPDRVRKARARLAAKKRAAVLRDRHARVENIHKASHAYRRTYAARPGARSGSIVYRPGARRVPALARREGPRGPVVLATGERVSTSPHVVAMFEAYAGKRRAPDHGPSGRTAPVLRTPAAPVSQSPSAPGEEAQPEREKRASILPTRQNDVTLPGPGRGLRPPSLPGQLTNDAEGALFGVPAAPPRPARGEIDSRGPPGFEARGQSARTGRGPEPERENDGNPGTKRARCAPIVGVKPTGETLLDEYLAKLEKGREYPNRGNRLT